MSSPNKPEPVAAANFITNIVEAALAAGKHAPRRWAGRQGIAADHATAPLDPARRGFDASEPKTSLTAPRMAGEERQLLLSTSLVNFPAH